MNHSLTILASAALEGLESSLKLQIASHNTVWEALIMTGSLMFVVGMAGLWAVYHSKRKRRRKHHHPHREQLAVDVSASDSSAEREEKKHRRRRRRSQPPMNPTLAQTGGLPPVRDTESSSYLP